MNLADYFPVWEKLTPQQRQKLSAAATLRKATKGTVVHNGSMDCLGLLLLQAGQLRACLISDEGREITVYRLFETDICLFTASCIMQNIQFEIIIQAEKDSEFLVIPPGIYKELIEESAPLANYTNQIMAARLSEAMWLIEQVMWKSFDKRLANFLLEETSLEKNTVLNITHETIANHLGTAREVVTRMLRYFQSEGMVKLSRGAVEVITPSALEKLSARK
ncbi:MAG: Crp/Fnr family transcriptional regulator [Acidaminococcaceae bacterium]|nr:Crp/Fnr family transcriptional regulator [Acidaminococcaceae bacterium]